jgi:hypothetical protein
MALPSGARGLTSFVAYIVVVIMVVGSISVVSYTGTLGVRSTTPTSGRVPGANGVFLNASNLPTVTSTVGPSLVTPEYFPAEPPLIVLYDDNMPFEGFQGSYCWPPLSWSQSVSCVNIAPADSNAIPVVAVYPNATISFGASFWRGLQGFTVTLYRQEPLVKVYSGPVPPNGLALNNTSGDYLLGVYASYVTAGVSSYYNLTTVSGPAARVDRGVSILVGDPAVHYGCFSSSQSTVCGPQWEDWPVTVKSNASTDVYLNASSVMLGAWAEFVPSHLSNVGPEGVQTHMILAGAVRPFVNNDISNVSMIIRGVAGNGGWGQALLPIEGGDDVVSIRSPSPVNITYFDRNSFGVTQNQSSTGYFPLVYDPGGAPTNASLTEYFSLIGMINGSRVSSVPSWLKLDVLSSSLTLQAYLPNYIELSVSASADTPAGGYALLIKGTVDGNSSYFIIPFVVSPPVYMGPP